jgi:Gas vesicle synthesis protein GvpL/GvpF
VTAILYLYALVDGEPAGPLGEGIAGEPLRVVRHGGIMAVVGEIGERPRPEAEILKRQDEVVRRLAETFDALLPARFGEAFADEAELLERIGPRHEDLAASLVLVRGCVQMTLRVFGEPETAAAVDEEDLAGGPGTRFLESRRRERQQARSLPEIDPLREALRPLLRAERIERHAAGRLLGTAYHLVPRSQTAAYMAALETARERIGGRRVAASGPWPPYAFGPEAAP